MVEIVYYHVICTTSITYHKDIYLALLQLSVPL